MAHSQNQEVLRRDWPPDRPSIDPGVEAFVPVKVRGTFVALTGEIEKLCCTEVVKRVLNLCAPRRYKRSGLGYWTAYTD